MHTKEIHIMRKRIVLITLIVTALAAVPLLYAAPRGMHHRMHGRGGLAFLGHLEKMREVLDLSEQQVDQIKAIVRTTHEQNKQYREQMHGGFKEVAKTLLANPNDIATAQTLLDQQTTAENAMKSNMVAAASKALNVLTPEQRTKLALHLAEHGERWENRGR
jgi:Spy/CpxP family protein refolding chaperone